MKRLSLYEFSLWGRDFVSVVRIIEGPYYRGYFHKECMGIFPGPSEQSVGRFSNRTGTSFRRARAAKIPRRIWVENAVVSWPRCDLARYTTPLCLFSNI